MYISPDGEGGNKTKRKSEQKKKRTEKYVLRRRRQLRRIRNEVRMTSALRAALAIDRILNLVTCRCFLHIALFIRILFQQHPQHPVQLTNQKQGLLFFYKELSRLRSCRTTSHCAAIVTICPGPSHPNASILFRCSQL